MKPRPKRWRAKQQADDWGYLLSLPFLGAAWLAKWVWRKARRGR